MIVGAAIGAAASYLTAHGDTTPAGRPTSGEATHGTPAPAARPRSTATHSEAAGTTSRPPASTGVAAGAAAEGALLNDRGYALIQRGDYSAAVPLLRRAVTDLRGVGHLNPYEAYANYNLGYALLQVGDCYAALPPLQVANRLETNPLVDVAIRRAASCAGQGS